MSRIGQRPLTIPQQVTVEIDPQFQHVVINGPLGSIKYVFNGLIGITVQERKLTTYPLKTTQQANMLHGTVNALLKNALIGVTKAFTKTLLIKGLGYKFTLQKDHLVLEVGFSHPVMRAIPANLNLELKKNQQLTISGIDKQAVGLFASQIRKIRPCEPYKGKGIHYKGEKIKRKLGKTASK